MAPVGDAAPPVNVHALHAQSTAWTTYVVRDGDNLSSIALRFGTNTQTLAQRNGIADPDMLLTGQRLQVPAGTAGSVGSTSTATPQGGPAKAVTRSLVSYVVKDGDTLSEIARNHGSTLAAVLKANRIENPDLILAGQVVQIPTRATVAPAAAPVQDASRSTTRPTPAPAPTRTPAAKTTAPATAGTKASTISRTGTNASAAAASRQELATKPVPGRSDIQNMIVATAQRHGVPTNLALAIGYQESGYNQRAVSSTNARGVMQIMPSAAVFASQLAGRQLDIYQAQDNITAGVLILKYNLSHARSMDEAIGGYYQGLGGVQQQGMYTDTKAYVASVRALMTRF